MYEQIREVKIFMFNLISEQERFEIFNTTYKFNTSCITEMQCENTAMFCNLTTNRCQCSL